MKRMLLPALAVALVVMIGWSQLPETTAEPPLAPNASFGPAEVVRIQVEALGSNGASVGNAGIRTAFRFASPPNRAATGPVEDFIELVNNPAYRDMLDHREAVYGELVVAEDRAAQRVTLTTLDLRQVDYVFFLSRYDTGSCNGCWMTDAVQRVGGVSAQTPRIGV
jgi:hypothetical protein